MMASGLTSKKFRHLSQVVRYQAMYELFERLNQLESPLEIAQLLTTRFKYVVDVHTWRYLSLTSDVGGADYVTVFTGHELVVTHEETALSQLSDIERDALQNRKFETIEFLDESQSDLPIPVSFQSETLRQVGIFPQFEGQQLIGVFFAYIYNQRLLPIELKFTKQVANFFSHRIYHLVVAQNLQRRLREARAKAELLSQRRATFLNQMTHELRTPMNAITSLTWFVANGEYGEVNQGQAEALQQVLTSSQFLTSLINDTLDLSKIEAGVMKFVFEDVCLEPLLQRVVSLVEPLIDERPIVIELDCDPELPAVHANERRLSQVVLNLLSNALKFTSDGFVKIAASALADDVLISIQDSGVGIPEDMGELIFENFGQVGNESKVQMGTGLGLPIAKELVELHQGRLWFESELDVGTTFFLQIPKTDQDTVL